MRVRQVDLRSYASQWRAGSTVVSHSGKFIVMNLEGSAVILIPVKHTESVLGIIVVGEYNRAKSARAPIRPKSNIGA